MSYGSKPPTSPSSSPPLSEQANVDVQTAPIVPERSPGLEQPVAEQPAAGQPVAERSLRELASSETRNRHLIGLNPQQAQAVRAGDDPLLILAGAGTGKTRVLVSRVADFIVNRGARPNEILAVTFTNKAAQDMRARIQEALGDGFGTLSYVGTFHSISARILRRYAERLGFNHDFIIIDVDDQIRLIKQLLSANQLDNGTQTARIVANLIDRWKNRAWQPEHVPEGEFVSDSMITRDFYEQYQQRLSAINALDFGDLIIKVIELIRTDTDVAQTLHRQFKYVLVDEYQDSNVAQYMWLRGMTIGNSRVTCVGDDDQSIYGWRGAEVSNILDFPKHYANTKIVRLEENYRSSPAILGAADAVIKHNKERMTKTLFASKQGPQSANKDKVLLCGTWDAGEEALLVSDKIESYSANGCSLNDIAVLVRTSSQLRAFEERFIEINMPYQVVGGLRFYERAEIRDAIAYLRLVNSHSDDLAFGRIVNVPKRGIGATSVAKLQAIASDKGTSLVDASRLLFERPDIKLRSEKQLKQFIEMLDRWTERKTTSGPRTLLETILDESGYMSALRENKADPTAGRSENIRELVENLDTFDTISGFLEHVSLVLDVSANTQQDMVKLMTLHSSKGLEFDKVFLPGWEEELFPSYRSLLENSDNLQEERRLAYVGLTRAKSNAMITFAASRMIHGRWARVQPSRFIDELDPNCVEIVKSYGAGGGGSGFSSQMGLSSVEDTWKEEQRASRSRFNSEFNQEYQASSNSPNGLPAGLVTASSLLRNTENSSKFSLGQSVHHESFGAGSIIDVTGRKLLVDFEKHGQKRVMADFVTAR